MKLRVYLDTSVFSARFDERAPDRMRQTEAFWPMLATLDAGTSELTRMEIAETPNAGLRTQLMALLDSVTVFPVSQEMHDLAQHYVAAGVFTLSMLNDAEHVAAAVLTGQDLMISWNFRHLVNRRRRAKIQEANTVLGLPILEIVSPPEV